MYVYTRVCAVTPSKQNGYTRTHVHDAAREPLAPGEAEALAVEFVHDVDGHPDHQRTEELAHHVVEPLGVGRVGGWECVQ